MPNNLLFYVVFLSQIILLSFYLPNKILSRIDYVFETYPPSKYPKLYPKPIEYFKQMQRKYKKMNLAIMGIGLLLLAVLMGYARNGERNEAIMGVYFFLQISPMMLIEIGAFKYYKLMRTIDTRTTRKAELRPRRLFDFVSPIIFGLAILIYVAFIVLMLYIRQFDFPWFGGYWNIFAITLANLFFAGVVIWHMYGKKRDPYQSYEDRTRQITLVTKQMVFMSIAATLFVALIVILASLDLRNLQPTVMSLYFQLITALGFRTLRIDTLNFDVYKSV